MCLSRLYRCVDKTIFQSLSHEAVALCLKNIHQAALMISQKKVNLFETIFYVFWQFLLMLMKTIETIKYLVYKYIIQKLFPIIVGYMKLFS